MRQFKPTHLPIYSPERFKIFLAGTIDMGNSVDWQQEVAEYLKDEDRVDIFNPRRDHWDSTWKQDPSNKEFLKQVNWELDSMERADLIIFNFLPDSKSPVTLLELGLHAGDGAGKVRVCCPKEFYRSGNVEIVCDRYDLPLYRDLKSLLNDIWKKYS